MAFKTMELGEITYGKYRWKRRRGGGKRERRRGYGRSFQALQHIPMMTPSTRIPGKLSALICKMGTCLGKYMGHHAELYKWKNTVLISASKGK